MTCRGGVALTNPAAPCVFSSPQITDGISAFRVEPAAAAPSPGLRETRAAEAPVLRRRILGQVRNTHALKVPFLYTFGATPNYLLLPAFPLVIDARQAFLITELKKQFLAWMPALGTHFHLLRRADGEGRDLKK